MASLKKENQITIENGKESHIRLRACIAAQGSSSGITAQDTRHCLAPPAPTEIEEDEMFGLEAGLVQLPVMTPISDPYVLEEAIIWTRNEKLHEVARDLGIFDEEEPKSSVDSHTVIPGAIRTVKATNE